MDGRDLFFPYTNFPGFYSYPLLAKDFYPYQQHVRGMPPFRQFIGRPNQRPLKISQLASLVHTSLPAQATPLARQIPLLQVETREKRHMKSGARKRNR